MKILIAFASKYGSTRETSEFIKKLLEEKNHTVEVKDVSEVDNLNYDFVILGSSVKIGKILPEAKNFLKKFADDFTNVKSTFFIHCVSAKEESIENQKEIKNFVDPVKEVMKPVSEPGIFAGKVDYSKIAWIWKKMAKVDKTGKMEEGDFRNWDEIKKWVNELNLEN